MTRLALGSSLLVSASLVGCGSVDPDPTDMGDMTPPAIMQVSPRTGDTGVRADAVIEVAFTEPMDRASVEAAYSSHHLAPDAVTMAWNATSDILTITPKQPLALAEGIGNDPSVTDATEYALWIATTATDAAGNALEQQLDLSFTTSKRMSTTAAYIPDLTRFRTSTGATSAVGTNLLVGDAGAITARGFVSFDLAALPTNIVIEKAALNVRQVKVNGTPFDMGPINAVQVTYGAVDGIAYSASAVGTIDPLTATADLGPRSADVSDGVAEDIADRVARANRSQYRLEFGAPTNGDGDADSVELATATFEMSITYLAP